MSIYLDNAATSWPKPEPVYQAVEQYLRYNGASPGRGGHSRARAAGLILYEAREQLAAILGIPDPNRICFTANATEALNTALFGVLSPGDTVITTAMEHNAVARPLRVLSGQGVQVKVARCGSDGLLDLDDMKRLVLAGAKAVVMTHASNVTGTLMPVGEVGNLTRERQCLLIVDAAQTAGVEKIDTEEMKIDILACSGHKGLLGPQGTGGIYARHGVVVKPLRFGGTGSLSEQDVQPEFMPDMLESGTANTPGIAGLAAGLKYLLSLGIETVREKETRLSQALRDGLNDIRGITVYGPEEAAARTAVVSFTLGAHDSSAISHVLDQEYGIASRGGLHCAPWAHRNIGTLSTGTVRLSPGLFNTMEDIEAVLSALQTIAAGGGRL